MLRSKKGRGDGRGRNCRGKERGNIGERSGRGGGREGLLQEEMHFFQLHLGESELGKCSFVQAELSSFTFCGLEGLEA